MVTPAEIESLLSQPEGIGLEFKSAKVTPRSLAYSIAAFANTNGGTIIVGVDEREAPPDRQLIGIDPERLKRLARQARVYFTHEPDIQVTTVPVRGTEIGVIQVTVGRNLALLDGKIPRRIGPVTTRSSISEITQSAPRQPKWTRRRKLAAIAIASLLISVAVFVSGTLRGHEPSSLIPPTLTVLVTLYGAGLVGLSASEVSTTAEVSRTRERVWEAEAELEEGLRAARHSGSSGPDDEEQARLALSDLWTVTHRRLDHYHTIALEQAAKSFRNAQAAMAVGFLLLIGFAIVGVVAKTTAGAVIAGALGAVSAALAGYVSRTFVRSQETAAGHLRAYFDQPLEFSRYLAAERLITDARLEAEQRAEVLGSLVQAMIAKSIPSHDGQDTT